MNLEKLTEAYEKKDFDAFAKYSIEIFQKFDHAQEEIGEDIESILKTFFKIIAQNDTIIPPAHIHRFLDLNPILANLAALSSFKNTDIFIEQLAQGENNFVKFLALYNSRNSFSMNTTDVFDADPSIASIWYSNYFRSAFGYGHPLVYENIQRHCRQISEKFTAVSPLLVWPYFGSSYLQDDPDIRLKNILNQAIKKNLQDIRVKNHPDPRKIAVISQRWVTGSSVYRNMQPMLEAWAQHYELSLILIGENLGNPDVSIFKDVQKIEDTGDIGSLSPILENNFQAIFYPDIGMNYSSVILSNLRLAPVQITSIGHPVSTFGGEIDYFISGSDSETLENKNYSERLILLPSIGVQIPFPVLARHTESFSPTEICHIALPWGVTKINFPVLNLLRQACDQIHRPVKFHLFPGSLIKHTLYRRVLIQDMEEIFGKDRIEIHGDLSVEKYFEQLQRCEFAMDAYPFGGCNSIMDVLWNARPVIAWQSARCPGRLGAAILRELNLSELIAENHEAYVQKMIHLANNPSDAQKISEKICEMDLQKILKRKENPQNYLRALEMMIQNVGGKSREPLVIA